MKLVEQEATHSTLGASATSKEDMLVSLTVCSPKLTKGKNEEEAKDFDRSYQRAKRVLKQLNAVFESRIERAEIMTDDPKQMNVPNWDKLVAWQAGYRSACRLGMELTRT